MNAKLASQLNEVRNFLIGALAGATTGMIIS